MELKWLEDFLALATTKNFSKAAAARNVTQPALSRRIRSLEHWMGVTLVDRSGYPMRLTEAGAQFQDVAITTVAKLKSARDQLRRTAQTDGSTIRFAALHTLALAFFPGWLAGISAGQKPIRSSMVTDNMHDCIELLSQGGCDFVLSYAHPKIRNIAGGDCFETLIIGKDLLLPVAATSLVRRFEDAISAGRPVPYLGYGPDSTLGQLVEVVRAQAGSPTLDLIYENSMAEALKAMALHGAGVAWLPASLLSQDRACGRLSVIGSPRLAFKLNVVLIRLAEPMRRQADRFWSFAASQTNDDEEPNGCVALEADGSKALIQPQLKQHGVLFVP